MNVGPVWIPSPCDQQSSHQSVPLSRSIMTDVFITFPDIHCEQTQETSAWACFASLPSRYSNAMRVLASHCILKLLAGIGVSASKRSVRDSRAQSGHADGTSAQLYAGQSPAFRLVLSIPCIMVMDALPDRLLGRTERGLFKNPRSLPVWSPALSAELRWGHHILPLGLLWQEQSLLCILAGSRSDDVHTPCCTPH